MSDTLKQIADNLGVTTINGSYLSGIVDYYGVDLATSTDLMRDILVEVGGNPATSTDYLQDIVLELGGTIINDNWMEGWQAITSGPPAAPVNTVLPNVTGVAIVGDILTTDDGSWTGSPTSYAYQWKRGATNIGTNANTYTLVNADAGQSITCVVTATNAGGSTPATSNAVQIQNFFTTQWTTTAPSETIELPYSGSGTYSGTIDWGDSTTSANSYANRTHTYATAGTYTVVINGTCLSWSFGYTLSGNNITSVVHWGQLQLGIYTLGYQFADCPNLDLSSVSDVLDLTGMSDLTYMFGNCTSLTSINRIGEWNTSSVTTMNAMFMGCTQINFNIGTWDVGSVVAFIDFMDSATTAFSTANLDAIYNGWSTQAVQPNLSITFGTAQYTTPGGGLGKLALQVAPNFWTITDGGHI